MTVGNGGGMTAQNSLDQVNSPDTPTKQRIRVMNFGLKRSASAAMPDSPSVKDTLVDKPAMNGTKDNWGDTAVDAPSITAPIARPAAVSLSKDNGDSWGATTPPRKGAKDPWSDLPGFDWGDGEKKPFVMAAQAGGWETENNEPVSMAAQARGWEDERKETFVTAGKDRSMNGSEPRIAGLTNVPAPEAFVNPARAALMTAPEADLPYEMDCPRPKSTRSVLNSANSIAVGPRMRSFGRQRLEEPEMHDRTEKQKQRYSPYRRVEDNERREISPPRNGPYSKMAPVRRREREASPPAQNGTALRRTPTQVSNSLVSIEDVKALLTRNYLDAGVHAEPAPAMSSRERSYQDWDRPANHW